MLLSPRFEQALSYACMLHSGQVRKGSEVPYISHLLAVAALALEHGASEDEAIAALLHDTVEDCGGLPRLADLRLRFGDAVAEIVVACTDTHETPKPKWRLRKETYLRHLPEAATSALLISACDKLHNARCTLADLRKDGDAVFGKFNGGKSGTLWYLTGVAVAYARSGRVPSSLLIELHDTVRQIHEYSGESYAPDRWQLEESSVAAAP